MLTRVIDSVIYVKANNLKSDILFKLLTIYNIMKKGIRFLGINTKLSRWIFSDTVCEVKINGMNFKFMCVKGKSHNIFMNPYFHEYDISRFLLNNLEKDDNFIDVGSMVGLYSIIAAKMGAKVISFEPNPYNIKILKENIKLNNIETVKIVEKAVSNKLGETQINWKKGEEEFTRISNKTKNMTTRVKLTTLDRELKHLEKIKLLKIDTEGHDFEVIQGSNAILLKIQHIIAENDNQIMKAFLEEKNFVISNLSQSKYLRATVRAY